MLTVDGGNLSAEISFLCFDFDGNGKLDKQEFMKCMKYAGRQHG